jgi:PucR family transcriptional regulator, purine catabolism regulatory protein
MLEDMSLTVQQLTEIESLRTRFLAGREGGHRPAMWAHSTELPDPWNWLGAGDLLLSNGYNVSAESAEQIKLLQELNRANVSGIAFSGRPEAPLMTPAALQVADELQFPVLETEYSVPWVTLSRIVADSNMQQSGTRLLKVLRQYDVLRRTYRSGAASNRMLKQLGKECDGILNVVDARSGAPLLPPADPIPDQVRQAVVDKFRDELPLPAFTRLVVSGETSLVLPVTSDGHAVMVASASSSEQDLDLTVLQHAATILGLEVERRAAVAARRRASGGRLLQQLLTGTIDVEAALSGLQTFGLETRPWRVICWRAESQLTIEVMQLRLAAAKVANLVGHVASEDVALVPANALDDHLSAVADGHPNLKFGVSLPVHNLNRMGDAAREARWALESARTTGGPIAVYGEGGLPFLPRSIAEGEAVVARLLGPLLDYDRANDAHLLHSLVAYLDANRSWQEAASALGVHRQTLRYRMRRVEELTGRRLQNLVDQTELYLAVRTWRMLRDTDDPSRTER